MLLKQHSFAPAANQSKPRSTFYNTGHLWAVFPQKLKPQLSLQSFQLTPSESDIKHPTIAKQKILVIARRNAFLQELPENQISNDH